MTSGLTSSISTKMFYDDELPFLKRASLSKDGGLNFVILSLFLFGNIFCFINIAIYIIHEKGNCVLQI